MAGKKHDELEIFARLKIGGTDLPRDCIRDFVRKLIISGTITPGSQIPSTRQLTTLWNVHIPTVHLALTDLLQEGLIVRRHGKGTYVADIISTLQTVAVYCGMGILSTPQLWFERSLIEELRDVLEERKIKVDVWVDSRRAGEREKIMAGLENAARKRDIQGLIILAQGEEYLRWATTLPIPIAEFTPLSAPFAVCLDVRQMAEISIRRLAELGCKSVGLISSRFVKDRDASIPAGTDTNKAFYNGFISAAKEHGLKVRSSWLRLPSRPLKDPEFSVFGNEQFHALWNQKNRPDGLLIEPDSAVDGMIPALLQRQVSVPTDLKLVMHRNQNHPLIFPFPASFVVSSERTCAEALMLQLEQQLKGRKQEGILVPYQIT